MSLFIGGLLRPLAFALATAALTVPATAAQELPAASENIVPLMTSPDDPVVDLMRLGVDMADRMTMPVQIGAGGPYPFIIDTGSHRSIVATELAHRLALQELAPVEIVSMAGRETVAAVQLGQMKFGTQVVNGLPVLSIAHDTLGSAGLIGLDSLHNKRLTMDFKKRQLTIGKSTPASATWDRNTIVVEARSKLGQLILVNSKIDGKRVNVILDTGAEISVGNLALLNNLRVKRLVMAPQKVVIKSVTGQAIEAQFAIVRSLQINAISLENVPMVFLDAEPFEVLGLADKPSMLLGMRMLRMFDRVAIDFGSRRVDFQVPQSRTGTRLSDMFLAAL